MRSNATGSSTYLTDTIRGVVRGEVLDPDRSAGKLYGQPRIFNNLLFSRRFASIYSVSCIKCGVG